MITSLFPEFIMSDRKPGLNELALALDTLSWSEIKSIAVQLRMEYFRLKQIEQQNTELSDRLLSAMDMWLNNDSNASWARIITALRDIDKNVLAKTIEQKYCQPLDTTHASVSIGEMTSNLHSSCCTLPPPSSPPHVENPVAVSQSSLPFPSALPISDLTTVTSPVTPHGNSSPGQQAPSQPSTDQVLPISTHPELTVLQDRVSPVSASSKKDHMRIYIVHTFTSCHSH